MNGARTFMKSRIGGGRVLLLGPLDDGIVPRPHKPGDGVALALHRFRVAEICFFPSHPLLRRTLLRRRNQESLHQ